MSFISKLISPTNCTSDVDCFPYGIGSCCAFYKLTELGQPNQLDLINMNKMGLPSKLG